MGEANEVRQINLTDEELAERLLAALNNDPFAKPLIATHIEGHRACEVECTKWIRRMLGWDQ